MTRLLACVLLAATCALALAACGGDDNGDVAAAPSEPPAWNHDPGDAELGPGAWGEIDESFEECRTGLSQSPVDITEAVDADLPGLEFDYPAAPLVVENTGHTIEVAIPEGSDHLLTVGEEEYRLLQYHFHAPSEHTRDGRSREAEVHLVHESESGELAVVGIFLERIPQPSSLVDLVLENAPEDAGEEVELDEERSPIEFFPALDDTTAVLTYYTTYPGSLTTPPCSEGVRWFVSGFSAGISAGALDRLHELIADFPPYDGYEDNNRPAQPLNDREIERRPPS